MHRSTENIIRKYLFFFSNFSSIFHNIFNRCRNFGCLPTRQYITENVCDLEVFRWNPARRYINFRRKRCVWIPNRACFQLRFDCETFVHYWIGEQTMSSTIIAFPLSKTVFLNQGSIEPLGFDGAVSGVRGRSSETWLKAWLYHNFCFLLYWAKWDSTKAWQIT